MNDAPHDVIGMILNFLNPLREAIIFKQINKHWHFFITKIYAPKTLNFYSEDFPLANAILYYYVRGLGFSTRFVQQITVTDKDLFSSNFLTLFPSLKVLHVMYNIQTPLLLLSFHDFSNKIIVQTNIQGKTADFGPSVQFIRIGNTEYLEDANAAYENVMKVRKLIPDDDLFSTFNFSYVL